MGARGKKSSAEVTVASLGKVSRISRPDAPYDLDDEAAEEWRQVVDRLPADWFPRETHPLLADYCRNVVLSRKIWQLIRKVEKAKRLDIEEYERLTRMAERATRVIASLATKMRISQQTQYDKKKARGSGGGRKPWDEPEDE